MTTAQQIPDWIAADWGTTHLRVWAMSGSTILAEAQSDQGMAALAGTDGFEAALLALIDGWLGAGVTPVIACGMVGARQGWAEAPYASVPVKPLDGTLAQARTSDRRIRVYVVPGLKQAAPADVMRGEETQVAGFLATHDDWDGVLCLPGTHTKWVHVSAGEVVSFATYMTGDLFAAISGHTVLKLSVGEGWDDDVFAAELTDTLSRPARLAAKLFNIRARDLLEGVASGSARAALSGALIGAEIAGAKPFWLGI